MVDINSLKFDNFSRTNRDIICVHPIRTIIKLEEEITIVKKLRKIEARETGLQCPLPSQRLINYLENSDDSVITIKEETQDSDKTSQDKLYLSVNSRDNCYQLNRNLMSSLQSTANSVQLESGTYVIKIKKGSFKYWQTQQNGEPWICLWLYGGKVINQQTNIEVVSTWVTLNGYDDRLILEVIKPSTLCGFFIDTSEVDNTGEIEIELTSPNAAKNWQSLLINAREHCYALVQNSHNAVQKLASSLVLKPGHYDVKISKETLSYWESGKNSEPLVLLWVHGGKFVNQKTNVEVTSTWSSLNGHDDILSIEVKQTTVLSGLLLDIDKSYGDNVKDIELCIVKHE